jgi:beta-lactamase superfamily II metal-dependent hydrolase
MLVDGGHIWPPADRALDVEPIDSGSLIHVFLERIEHPSLDYVVLTHYDADHLGGFVTTSHSYSILWQADCTRRPTFPTRELVDPGTPSRTNTSIAEWQRCLAGASERVSIDAADDIGHAMDLGGGWTATVVAGQGYVLGRADRVPSVNTDNERSIAVLVSGPGGFDFLVTGDLIGRPSGAENAPVEPALGAALAARGVDLELLQVGHHGAANASEPGFVDALRPEVAVVATGKNSYGHPSCEAYESLTPPEVQIVLQTERGNSPCEGASPVQPIVANGTIRVTVTDDRWTVSSYGEVSPLNGFPTAPFAFDCTVGGPCVAR